MKTFWIISGLWLVACIVAIWWVLPRLDASDMELLHAEAIKDDEEWEDVRSPGWKYPHIANYTVGSPVRVSPAREIEALDDTWDGAA